MSAVPCDREERQHVDTLRVPPHSIEAEQSVIGGVMVAPKALAKISDWLKPEDFYSNAHRLIYAALIDMAAKGNPIDIVTVGEYLEANGIAEQVGGAAYVTEVAGATPSAANIVAYAEIVVEKSRLRQAIEIGTNVAGEAFDHGAQSELVVAEGIRQLSRLQTSRIRGGLKSARELLPEWMRGLQDAYSRGEAVTGLATPWAEVNRITHGLQPGDLIVVAARPNMGKTVFALQLAIHAALALEKRAAVFSLEMGAGQVLSRAASALTGVQHDWILSPANGSEHNWNDITRAMSDLHRAPLLIDDQGKLTAEQIAGRARRAHMQAPIGLIVVDHLHELRLLGKTSADRVSELGESASALKNLGKDLGCPVVALAQLNRELFKRNDKRPVMSDLRASGDIEQIADLILLLHREDYYDKKTHLKDVVEVIVGKGRNIRSDQTIHLRNRFDVMRLDDWEGELPLPPVEGPKTRSGGLRKRAKQDPVAEAYAE